ncbi:MAG: DUF3180 domain-containing protein [Bifidobacteriaceae bacterium]|jgi:hypothetical protein|nr:DUF3180 domain-containing protein [Bifidobacteriaceae bacterium]
MTLTRISTLATVAAVSTVASAAVVDLAGGVLFERADVPWAVAALLIALAAGILLAAWPVRQYAKGNRRRIDPLRAATILALAKSCSLAGAALLGLYLGMALVEALSLHSALAWTRLWQEAAAALAALALSAAGRIAEWFCRLPPEAGEAAPAGPEPTGSSPA